VDGIRAAVLRGGPVPVISPALPASGFSADGALD